MSTIGSCNQCGVEVPATCSELIGRACGIDGCDGKLVMHRGPESAEGAEEENDES